MHLEQRCCGVNLLDLAAVLLIAFGVATILQPVFVRAHDAAVTSCKANLKQIGLAAIEYADDYDLKYPGGSGHWAGDIYPYIKSPPIFRCPSDSVSPAAGDEVSYALNTNLQDIKGGHSLAMLTEPSRTVCAIEYDGTPAIVDWNVDSQSKTTTGKGKNTAWGDAILGRVPPTGALRHDPFINVLGCDGHVRSLLASQISSGRDSADSKAAQTPGGAAGTDTMGTDYIVTFSEK